MFSRHFQVSQGGHSHASLTPTALACANLAKVIFWFPEVTIARKLSFAMGVILHTSFA